MREVKHRRTGATLRWVDVHWADLSVAQRHDVMHGEACGDPSNRPHSVAQAVRWRYWLSPDKSEVIGVSMGVIGFSPRGVRLRKF